MKDMLSREEKEWLDDRAKKITEYEEKETRKDFIDDDKIESILQNNRNPEPQRVRDILSKARLLKGLTPEEAAVLLNNENQDLWQEIFETAHQIKQQIYGNRIVLFAPLYISNPCVNNCAYCGFRHSNDSLKEMVLSMEELEKEVQVLTSHGHKRLVIVYGEHPVSDVDFMCKTIEKIYATKDGDNEIRRVNINAAPLFVDEYEKIKEAGIGTYQIFQETYHHETYKRVHPKGSLKSFYKWRLFSLHRAQEAGIDDVAIGALLGLYDWKFEVLGLLYHAMDLEREFGVGPHTISFPRLEPAVNTPFLRNLPYKVSDEDFKKLVAVIRCSVPYTGMILTCRESPKLRKEVIPLGVSQIDAGSNIAIRGYQDAEKEGLENREQFQLADSRPLDDVLYELCEQNYIPSFCTAGYRAGRTGCQFMSFAKEGKVKYFCTPNAILTFKEYLMNYASPKTKMIGEKVINAYLEDFKQEKPQRAEKLREMLNDIEGGKRDLYF
ncbi:[FeFe] hydrogenase H-cluster radical SAM maturase HydG [Aceticella autotrophica]